MAAQKPAPISTKTTERGCTPIIPTESCIITEMDSSQRGRIIGDIKKSGAKWCRGELMVLSGFPHYVQITTAPTSFNAESPAAYKLTGLLGGAALPTQVEIKCRAR
jgi:hypothetical protein